LDGALSRLGTTYTFFMGGLSKAVLTIDPQAARYILQKNHRNYEKSAIVTDLLAKYTGYGLLTASGDKWLRQRRLIQPAFHKKRIEALQSLVQAEIDQCMERWEAFADTKQSFDAYPEMNQLTFRIIARALFSQSLEENGMTSLSGLISTIQAHIVKEVRQPWIRWWYELGGRNRKHIALAGTARAIIREVIQERKKMEVMPDDLLTMLLETRYEDTGQGMEEEQLIDECLILFVAGHETGANALSWMLYLLGQHQDVYQRIQSTEGEARQELIHHVILETMRLYPPAWVIDRISLEDDQILDYTLPKGTVWIVYIRGIHRNPEYWPEADQFDPERWRNPEIRREAYMPFGAGPRLCIGEH
ncbi:MAG TPA: cytochrome P450, partial [Saprospiraceae bacterium]|nr:cytochrome P450 [Saprospiraceae bacterium]